MDTLCSIGELALILGVAISTLRRWHAAGVLIPQCRTLGGHRRYCVTQAKEVLGLGEPATERVTLAYARVSSHDQKEQLQTQAQRLEQHCALEGWSNVQTITDLGSGMNYKKPGLAKLLRLILQGSVARLVLVTKDRLLRFGAELLFQVCRVFNVEVVILDEQTDIGREQQLTLDLIEILAVFSSRLYGSRSRKNLRAVAASVAL
jgi:putative resolvase